MSRGDQEGWRGAPGPVSPLQQTPEGHGSQELREAVASRLGLSSLASKPAASQAEQQAETRAVLEPLLPDPGAAAVIEIRPPGGSRGLSVAGRQRPLLTVPLTPAGAQDALPTPQPVSRRGDRARPPSPYEETGPQWFPFAARPVTPSSKIAVSMCERCEQQDTNTQSGVHKPRGVWSEMGRYRPSVCGRHCVLCQLLCQCLILVEPRWDL